MSKIIKDIICVNSNIGCVAEVEQFADLFFQKVSISQKMYGKVYLSLAEATVNAIRHGNKNYPNKQVTVQIEKSEQKIVLIIKDMGEGFDYNNIQDPTIPSNLEKPHGRGIFIISNLSDEIEFNELGSEIKITFNIE